MVPAVPVAADTAAVNVGVAFTSSQSVLVTGIRFYKGTGNTGTHVGSLWSGSGQLLAQATFTGETATGWQEVSFATPVQINAGTTYVASYHAPKGRYSVTSNYFTSAYTSGPLTALKSVPGRSTGATHTARPQLCPRRHTGRATTGSAPYTRSTEADRAQAFRDRGEVRPRNLSQMAHHVSGLHAGILAGHAG